MLRLIGTDHNQYYAWKLPAGEYLIGRNIGSKTKADFSVADRLIVPPNKCKWLNVSRACLFLT